MRKEKRKKKTATLHGNVLYKNIRLQIEKQFKASNGQFDHVEEVVAELEMLAKKYNDPIVSDLYYFDEKRGRFLWDGRTK